ncbi:putative protein with domain of unknown function (DUF3337) [Lyophyllum shimeji]|uniref:WD40 repeat-like protein n=1 Tax=Lyophyllum shimeji TaxID=47721 RepID=A0A9P3PXJ3_LYOSH|nr:putative protein with domain of unknown function (DUF3337) [Lyophyllum shimeji]
MVQQRRRVSYVITAPVEPPPRLQLPPHGISRLGSIGPLLIPLTSAAEAEAPSRPRHPRHRLGISSLALDTSTQLAGRGAPEGILYSAGRDGLVISWDLGIPMKKRKPERADSLRRAALRWETMTGWADEGIDEETEDGEERVQSDGDVLGDVPMSGRRPRKSDTLSTPYEDQWETDLAAFKPGKRSEFRQCAQINSDWVNDILLCNRAQTVISASSDGTVKAWSPHLPHSPDPSTLGTHGDYVRCLAQSREQNWVASGSFDRTIKLWDLSREGQHNPLVTLNPPDVNAPKSSIYALAADPYGTTLVSGSPERVVRLWDPRTGRRTGKLVGHTDNIRAILISEDARYLLTGSADASIKLWSLASQRCLHTFTHHTESVWSLHSSHPSLEVFYSGDRSGLVCKVDVEDCSDISEGECILLCQDADPSTPSSDGINRIVAMDDNLLWTASGHSNIKRWAVPQRRSVRASALLLDPEDERYVRSESPVPFGSKDSSELMRSAASTRPSTAHGPGASSSVAASTQSLSSDTWPAQAERDDDARLYGIPFESLIRLISPNEAFAYTAGRGRDPEVATLYSAASIKSVPRTNVHAAVRAPAVAAPADSKQVHTTSPIRSARTDDTAHPAVSTARADYEERELASDAIPLQSEPEDVIRGEHGLVRSIILNDRIHALTVDTSGEVAVWDIVRCMCLGRFARDDVAALSAAGSWAGGSGGERERSPREALEAVRERIEGEAVVSQWCTADTKTGVLTVHLTEKSFEAEVYADEVGYANDRRFNDESKINVGKWVLRNLFLGFIREQQRIRREQDESNTPSEGILAPSLGRANGSLHDQADGRSAPTTSPEPSRRSSAVFSSSVVVKSPSMIPALPPPAAPPTRPSPLLTPLIPLHVKDVGLTTIPQTPTGRAGDTPGMPRRHRSATVDDVDTTPSAGASHGDYFIARRRQPSLSGAVTPAPDDFSGWSGPTPVNTPGGLMGRLKNFGKTKRPSSEVTSSPAIGSTVPSSELTVSPEDTSRPVEVDIVKTPAQVTLSGPITPPPSAEAPTYPIPPNTTILMSEEAAPSFVTVYRGTVSSTKQDVRALEEAMPLWLLEYLLLNKIPPLPAHPKISFVLLPWPTPNPEDQLPELLNTAQSKLTSSRYLRVRKLVIHVQEKLEKISGRSRPASADEGHESQLHPHPRAEDEYEILCNDVLLHLGMSLAVVRQYAWKQSSELTMFYRRKTPSSAEQRRSM